VSLEVTQDPSVKELSFGHSMNEEEKFASDVFEQVFQFLKQPGSYMLIFWQYWSLTSGPCIF
jgi:hypothetical protein